MQAIAKHNKVSFIIILCLSVVSCGPQASQPPAESEHRSDISIVRDQPISDEMIKALEGSPKDSSHVAMQLSKCASGGSVEGLSRDWCLEQSDNWNKVDYENGGSFGLSVEFTRLIRSNRCAPSIRASYVAKKLAVITGENDWIDRARNARISCK